MKQILNIISGMLIQTRILWKSLLLYIYLPVLTMLGLTLIMILTIPSINPSTLFRDITARAELPFYTGFMSQIGAQIWTAALTVTTCSYFFLKVVQKGLPSQISFLVFASIFTAVLLVDDLFLFHEQIAPDYLLIDQKLVYGGYLSLAAAFVYFNRNEILSSDYLILVLALLFLGASIFFDVFDGRLNRLLFQGSERGEHILVFLEDGSKFVGIATWCGYYVRYAYSILRANLS
ncbi:MAG TPA: hypothetical protein PKL78_08605 [Anaerolineales bacterium]|nr:hypothetical protein [Anaerolineales bacterium]